MMTVAEILEQVKALSPQEYEELLAQLPVLHRDDVPDEAGEHWGKNLIRLLDEIGPIEMVHPEIEDPVEWVKTIRREERQRRLGDWGDDVESMDSAE